MARRGTRPLHDPQAQIERSAASFVRNLETGQPREVRRRSGPAWALLALSLALVTAGLVLPQGVILASGLITAGTAAYLLAPPHDPDRPSRP
ncbi:hypothetical protein AB0K68_36110 [Streptomyces sp. NPDC050698]